MERCPHCQGRKFVVCPQCQGSGTDDPALKNVCKKCKGKGEVECPDCRGKGVIISPCVE
jgi:DnaJ-class molecular chaperone